MLSYWIYNYLIICNLIIITNDKVRKKKIMINNKTNIFLINCLKNNYKVGTNNRYNNILNCHILVAWIQFNIHYTFYALSVIFILITKNLGMKIK